MLPWSKSSPLSTLSHRGWMILCWLQILVTVGLTGILFSPSSSSSPIASWRGSRAPKQLTTDQLFTDPDAIGAIALGVAEGTRTPNGGYTPLYFGHTDPGNAQHNLGTFAYQHGAYSPEEADQKQLARIQPWVTQLQIEAKALGVPLGTFELVAGVDLMNQSPQAGRDYIKHLKKCQVYQSTPQKAVLCARVRSFVNPRTGQLEAGGLGSERTAVQQDQQRRIQAIERVLR